MEYLASSVYKSNIGFNSKDSLYNFFLKKKFFLMRTDTIFDWKYYIKFA